MSKSCRVGDLGAFVQPRPDAREVFVAEGARDPPLAEQRFDVDVLAVGEPVPGGERRTQTPFGGGGSVSRGGWDGAEDSTARSMLPARTPPTSSRASA